MNRSEKPVARPSAPFYRAITLLLTAAAAFVPQAAWAQSADADEYINPDRPGIADGSTVVGAGRFQIEAGIQHEYRGDGGGAYTRQFFVPALLRFGLTDKFELRIESNTYSRMKTYDPTVGTTTDVGAAPTSIGFKYQFADSAGWERPSMGVIVRLFPPSGSASFRSAHTTGDIRLAADWEFASQWSLNPNIGVALYEDNSQRTYTAGLFAMTLNYNPTKVLNFFVDTGVQTPETKRGGTSAIFDVGVAYIIGHNLQVDLAVGSGAAGTTSPDLFVAAGVSKRF